MEPRVGEHGDDSQRLLDESSIASCARKEKLPPEGSIGLADTPVAFSSSVSGRNLFFLFIPAIDVHRLRRVS